MWFRWTKRFGKGEGLLLKRCAMKVLPVTISKYRHPAA